MEFYRYFYLSCNFTLLFFALLLLSSCISSTDKSDSTDTPVVELPHLSSNTMEVKTYEVTDSTGKSQGWGYDIYIEGKKTIHQPIIPAIPGNRSFKTEHDALETGIFALNKMKNGGSLPTLLIKELDSLGVTK